MTINKHIVEMMGRGDACKDFMTFLSIHAKGNTLQMGMCEKACGITALLYGLEQRGGHLWTVTPFALDLLKIPPFFNHPQWTLIEGEPLEYEFVRTGGVPEEIDLFYLNPSKDKLDTMLTLKCWGHSLKTTGLIIVSNVKADPDVAAACDEYAKSYGMKFHVRQAEADLGVIYYPDNKEALKS